MVAPSSQSFSQISVQELAELLTHIPTDVQLVDVREPYEVELASLPGFDVLPLSEYAEWSDQIQGRFDPTKATVVLCHHGVRSAQMCQWLINQGFTNVQNVVGGIDAYAAIVDRDVPRY